MTKKLDAVVAEAGDFGRFQIMVAILIGFGVALTGTHSTTFLFAAGNPDYRCFVEGCDDAKNSSLNQPWLKNAIPSSSTSYYKPTECLMYKRNERFIGNDFCSAEAFLQMENETVTCERWIFDPKEQTIVNDYNLTCPENQWLLSLIGTTQCIAHLLGSLIGGDFSDRFGRKWTMVGCGFVMAAAGIAQSFAGNYMVFQITHFIQSMGVEGFYVVGFVICVESMGKKWRCLSGPIISLSFAIGEVLLGPAAYLERNWMLLKMYTSAPAFITVFYYWIIPESTRWLVAKKRFVEAQTVLIRIARMNKRILSPQFYEYFDEQLKNAHALREEVLQTTESIKSQLEKPSNQLFRSKTMWLRTLELVIIWIVTSFVFYGITFNSTNLGGNKYVDFSLISLAEVPGVIVAYWLLKYLGRKRSLIFSYMLCGISCAIASIFTQNSTIIIILSLLGKCSIAVTYPVIYVYTAELFPTASRGYGVGICSTLARIGSSIAPLTSLLDQDHKWILMLIYAGTAMGGALITLALPETKGRLLPETLREAKDLGNKQNLKKKDIFKHFHGHFRTLHI